MQDMLIQNIFETFKSKTETLILKCLVILECSFRSLIRANTKIENESKKRKLHSHKKHGCVCTLNVKEVGAKFELEMK